MGIDVIDGAKTAGWSKYFSFWTGKEPGQTYMIPAPTNTYTVTTYRDTKPFYYHSCNGKRWK